MSQDGAPYFYTPLTIQAIIEETPGFKTFVFERGHRITYKPGQFLTIVHANGSEEVRRSYSITSAPVLHEPLSIGVRRIANGFLSRRLVDAARVGDVLTTTGAGGFFQLPDDMTVVKTIFFFAAGSGITPVFSLLKTVLYAHPQVQVFLIYSNHSIESAIFYSALKTMQEQFAPQLHIDFLFSTDPDLKQAHLNRDLLLYFLASYAHNPATTLFYTCGPEAYMRLVIYLLQEAGIQKSNMKKEDFIPVRYTIPKVMPPDTATHAVTFIANGTTTRLAVTYPETILAAANKAKLSLPYSCETGKCGSCVARCRSGQVWLSANEVLTEKELAQGLTLTCVGYPVHGDVVLQFDSV